MTFYPEKGKYSIENFNSSEGAVFDTPSLQGIVAGYVTLKSQVSGSSSYINTWNTNIDWTFENPLYSIASILATIDLFTGVLGGGLTNTVTGAYGVAPNSTSWFFDTSYPEYISGYGYSGRGDFAFGLTAGGPSTIISDSYDAGSEAITFEFDVSSDKLYSGQSQLAGFSATGNNLTSLPALTGVINHGLLFCDGTRWDFIEITPYGIRSLNHPELAIPINLYSPKKIRVGFRGFDLFMATEDGRGVVGYNKFDTEIASPPTDAFAIFGAPSYEASYTNGQGILTGVVATVGRSTWDNLKVLTGDMAIFEMSGIEQLYTTGYSTMYTATYDPGVYINKYLYANIGVVPFKGGETIVSSQYSGAAGWTTHNSVTLSDDVNDLLDLSSLPIVSYPREDGGVDYLSNPIRFRVDQRSYQGDSLPPAVEYIELFASTNNIQIDMIPDWKQVGTTVKSKIYVETGTFVTDDPVPELWTSFLFNTPETTGQYGSTFMYDEKSEIPIRVQGTGEVSLRGPFRASFKNFVDISKVSATGSDAYQYFGGQPVYNFFPNPLFSDGFRTLGTGEANYYTGISEGEIASSVRLASTYTGSHNIQVSKQPVYRPETQARVNKINGYLGRTSSPNEEYVQSVHIYGNATDHDGTVGIEAIIPSGIATGNLKVTFDIEISEGPELELTLVGSDTTAFHLPGELFRSYRTVSFPVVNTNDHEFLVRFNIPSGQTPVDYDFNIDNLTVSSYNSSYLYATGLECYLHRSGVPFQIEDVPTPRKAATVFNTALYLYSYPESEGTLLNLTGVNNRGLDISINSSGYVTATMDMISNVWSVNSSSEPTYTDFVQEVMVSNAPLPLGRWTDVGFLHCAHNYTGWALISDSGDTNNSYNFTAANRAFLTFDGYPVASTDVMTGWANVQAYNLSIYPHSSYIDLTGSVRATMVSGISCEVDAIHILRPPVAEVETELTLKGARAYVPYFVPDSLYKGNNEVNNYLITGGPPTDLMIGSCYNFSSPFYTHWDRGPLRNHLIYHGDISKDLLDPYGQDLYSVRFTSGAYAVAPYSSSYERLHGTSGQLGVVDPDTLLMQGKTRAMGWLYPRTTGSFFTAYEDSSNLTGSRIELVLDTDNYIKLNKYGGTTNSVVYTNTGHYAALSGWTYVNVEYTSTGTSPATGIASISSAIYNESGLVSLSEDQVGAGFGFRYRSSSLSEFHFGGSATCNLFNWVLPISNSGETDLSRNLHGDHDKSGRYQAVVKDNVIFTGLTEFPSYHYGYLTLGPGNTGEDYYFGLAMHNSYDVMPRLHGIVAYDNKPFREVNSYNILYNTQAITASFGDTTSAIRVGNQVPSSAINIARFSSPSFTVPSSIATIDLSDSNVNNLISYRNGRYDIGGAQVTTLSTVTGYRDINQLQYSGRYDVVISGQILSSDIEISNIAITDQETNTYDKAFYYYLIGRGDRAVKVIGTFPHYTGQIFDTSTGQIVDNYTANLQRIKNSIKLKNSKGEIIDKQSYPYDIAISTYTPDDLYFSALSGNDIYLDNIGGYTSGRILPDTVFTAILLTNKNVIPGQSVFVHYDAYDIYSSEDLAGYKEIVNPQPIFREKISQESPGIGNYSLSLNNSNYYDLTFYGLATGYSGQL